MLTVSGTPEKRWRALLKRVSVRCETVISAGSRRCNSRTRNASGSACQSAGVTGC